jgi:hypothetical protein
MRVSDLPSNNYHIQDIFECKFTFSENTIIYCIAAKELLGGKAIMLQLAALGDSL